MTHKLLYFVLFVFNLALLLLNLVCGSVQIPMSALWGIVCGDASNYTYAQSVIVLESRLPAALCALLTGGALGACGLLLQSYFRNPLAGPSILGITSGAQLMVALVTLTGFSISTSVMWGMETVVAAMIGAIAMLLLLLSIGKMVRSGVGLLIVGILLSYLVSALLTLLNFYASADGVQSLLVWGMGSFSNIPLRQLPLYGTLICVALFLSAILIKPLNGWMLGDLYARNLGINIRQTRWMLLLSTGLLCAITTAWCGPISFVGLSIPHVARLLARSDDHRRLLILSILLGALCCSGCLYISTLPGNGHILPINALTPIVGIPVVLWVILKGVMHKKQP